MHAYLAVTIRGDYASEVQPHVLLLPWLQCHHALHCGRLGDVRLPPLPPLHLSRAHQVHLSPLLRDLTWLHPDLLRPPANQAEPTAQMPKCLCQCTASVKLDAR